MLRGRRVMLSYLGCTKAAAGRLARMPWLGPALSRISRHEEAGIKDSEVGLCVMIMGYGGAQPEERQPGLLRHKEYPPQGLVICRKSVEGTVNNRMRRTNRVLTCSIVILSLHAQHFIMCHPCQYCPKVILHPSLAECGLHLGVAWPGDPAPGPDKSVHGVDTTLNVNIWQV